MKQTIIGIIYGLGIVTIGTVAIMLYQQNHEVSTASAGVVATSTQPLYTSAEDKKYIADLAMINQNCVLYYEYIGLGTDTFSVELTDYSNLHPLSDFLCGEYSLINKKTQPDGKTLYLVTINGRIDCGSGGCTTEALLEEQPGLVRHIANLSGFYDRNLNLISTE